MNNIFNIQAEFFDIFNELEYNGGELTPELEEQLAITQESFKEKIKSYSEYIKSLTADNKAIDEEIARLRDLKASKKKTIDRVTKIIVDSIEMFGDTAKSGVKFVDFGTGKVSIRTTSSVEVDNDSVNGIVDSYKSVIGALLFQNQLDVVDEIDEKLLAQTAEEHTTRVGEEEYNSPISFTEEDLKAFDGKISFKTKFINLLKGKHLKALKTIIEACGEPELEASVSKTDLKNLLKDETNNLTMCRTVKNKSINIK